MSLSRLQSSPEYLENLVSEIKVHWLLEKCDAVLGLHEIYEDDDYLALVLDYQEGGTIY